MRCRSRSRVSFPRPRKCRPLPLEEDVDVDATEKDAADGERSTGRDFERSHWAGDWRKRGSLDAGVAGTVGRWRGRDSGSRIRRGWASGRSRYGYGGGGGGGLGGGGDDGHGLSAVPRLPRASSGATQTPHKDEEKDRRRSVAWCRKRIGELTGNGIQANANSKEMIMKHVPVFGCTINGPVPVRLVCAHLQTAGTNPNSLRIHRCLHFPETNWPSAANPLMGCASFPTRASVFSNFQAQVLAFWLSAFAALAVTSPGCLRLWLPRIQTDLLFSGSCRT
ncbi:hypothetical protein C8R44DRAFT_725585 [Mycena epipterygia]|nr:hypothetical protein C8R44DRAFT_725585 [Mycena epipterygia]